MASGPYQHHSEAELLELRRALNGSINAVNREKRDYEKRVGVGFWDAAGYKEIEQKLKGIWNQVRDVDEELAARRRERASAPSPPAGWYPDPNGRAPFRWWDGNTWTEHTTHAFLDRFRRGQTQGFRLGG